MNIAIDCRPLQNRYAQAGIGTVTRNLLAHLVKSRFSSSIILCGSTPQPPIRCGRYVQIKRPLNHEWLHEQLRWPLDLHAMHAGIFHSTVSLGLLREIGFPFVAGTKTIATVYDLTALRMPELAAHARMKSFLIQKQAVRRADRVLTISSFVKKDLMERLGIRENRITILPLAVDEGLADAFDRFSPGTTPPAAPYILGLGEGEHKNIAAVIGVFERLCGRGFAGELRVVGSPDRQCEAVKGIVRDSVFRDRIVFTGRLTIDQLVANYAQCRLFLFPSQCEGFGLPVIEAMYCSAPVITSNTTSLPEAGGEAALYADPKDVETMTALAGRIMSDEPFREELVARGMAHARRRTWSDAAEVVMGVYEELGQLKV